MDATYGYCRDFYNLLESKAEMEMVNGVPLKLFRGPLTGVYKELGIGQSYYSMINRTLREMGCVTLMRRGARGSDSVLALHHPPDETEFLFSQSRRLTDPPPAAKLTERIERLERRLGGVDIGKALNEIDERLTKLEKGGTIGKTP